MSTMSTPRPTMDEADQLAARVLNQSQFLRYLELRSGPDGLSSDRALNLATLEPGHGPTVASILEERIRTEQEERRAEAEALTEQVRKARKQREFEIWVYQNPRAVEAMRSRIESHARDEMAVLMPEDPVHAARLVAIRKREAARVAYTHATGVDPYR